MIQNISWVIKFVGFSVSLSSKSALVFVKEFHRSRDTANIVRGCPVGSIVLCLGDTSLHQGSDLVVWQKGLSFYIFRKLKENEKYVNTTVSKQQQHNTTTTQHNTVLVLCICDYLEEYVRFWNSLVNFEIPISFRKSRIYKKFYYSLYIFLYNYSHYYFIVSRNL